MKCSCSQLNVLASRDPTRTLTLRNQFAADMKRRFAFVRKTIRQVVGEMDALGLGDGSNSVMMNKALKVNEDFPVPALPLFEFRTDSEKIDEFIGWLNDLEETSILEITALGNAWTDIYIDSAYKRGVHRGATELANAGIELLVDPEDPIAGVLAAPIQAERVKVLYTRVFQELKGIDAAMDQQISRVLSEGIIGGLGPRAMAREMVKVVDGISKKRAVVLARTEVIRAHHLGNIATYRQAGIENVIVKAEWVTAGDNRVCPLCEPLDGVILSIDTAEALIPRHPQCRCMVVPVTEGGDPDKFAEEEISAEEVIERGEDNLNRTRRTPVEPGSTAPQ